MLSDDDTIAFTSEAIDFSADGLAERAPHGLRAYRPLSRRDRVPVPRIGDQVSHLGEVRMMGLAGDGVVDEPEPG